MKKAILIAIAVILSLSAYAQHKQTGKATYYANSLHGRKTSSGEIYNKDSLTCAHRTLPFGTLLRVRDKATGKEVIVEVTDRGPFSGAIIDLSWAAAKELDMCYRGTAMVEISEVTAEELSSATTPTYPVVDCDEPSYPQLMVLDETTGNYIPMWQWAEQTRTEYDKQLAAQAQEQKAHEANKPTLPARWRSLGVLSAKAQ